MAMRPPLASQAAAAELQHGPGVEGGRLRPEARGAVVHGGGQLLGVHRLREVVVHAGGQAFLAVADHGVRGERDDGQARRAGLALAAPDGDRRGEAVHHRHLYFIRSRGTWPRCSSAGSVGQ
jgi:hypothetical protein